MRQIIDFNKDMQEKKLHNTFKFRCVKGCKECCSMNDVALYPFDIMQICQRLNITSHEFHQRYSRFWFDSKAKVLRCYLKTSPVCVFFDEGCKIYDSRPARCRLFPLGRMFNQDDTIQYYIPKEKCIGFDSKQKHTIQSWLDSCGIKEKDFMIKEWTQFIIEMKNNPKLPLTDKFFMMFFQKIFYDFDNDLHEVTQETKDQYNDLDKTDFIARMALQYKLASIYLYHNEDWKKFYEKMDKEMR